MKSVNIKVYDKHNNKVQINMHAKHAGYNAKIRVTVWIKEIQSGYISC